MLLWFSPKPSPNTAVAVMTGSSQPKKNPQWLTMHCFSFQALILKLSGLRSCIFNEESIQAVLLLENSCLTSLFFWIIIVCIWSIRQSVLLHKSMLNLATLFYVTLLTFAIQTYGWCLYSLTFALSLYFGCHQQTDDVDNDDDDGKGQSHFER